MNRDIALWGPLILFFVLDIIIISRVEDIWVKTGSFLVLFVLFSMLLTIRIWILFDEEIIYQSEDEQKEEQKLL